METWVNVVGFENLYMVSNLGRVKSLNYRKTGKQVIMKPTKQRKGYLAVRLSGKEKKMCKIHRLVAIAFIPNPENKPQVNHKDGNKENNSVENLEWNTAYENNHHAISTGLRTVIYGGSPDLKLSMTEVQQIRSLYSTKNFTCKQLAQMFDCSGSYIGKIVKGKRRKIYSGVDEKWA